MLVAVSLGFGRSTKARTCAPSQQCSAFGQPLLVPSTAGGPLSHPTVCLYIDGQLQVSSTSPYPLHAHLLPPTWRRCVPSLSPVSGTNYRGQQQPPRVLCCPPVHLPAPCSSCTCQATVRLKYPAIRDPLSSVCVGAGALLSPLRGQAGAALFFEEVLLPGEWCAAKGRPVVHSIGKACFCSGQLFNVCCCMVSGVLQLGAHRPARYVRISVFSGQAFAATRLNPATCVLRPLPPRAAQVAALHQLGPNYQSPLLACESSGLLDQHPAAAAALALGAAAAPPAAGAGGEASSGDAATAAAAAAAQQGQPPKLLLAFCPQLAAAEAQEGQAGASGSSSGRARGGSRGMREAVLGLPAALLPGTQLCRTQQPHSMLHCLGGIAALLPLLEHQPTGAEVAGVVRLVAALLRGSPTNQQAVQQAGGFALMAHLLERRVQAQGPGLLTSELLAAQQQLLGAVNESQDLSHSALRWVGGRAGGD